MNIEEYITTLTEQIRFKQARQGVAQEIRNHIFDQTQAYEQSGMEHNKAVEMAVREMGDPVEAGVALDRVHRPQFDWRLFLMTVFFSLAGIFLMYVTGALGQSQEQLARQCLYTFIGIGIILLIYFADYTFIGKYALPIYIVMSILFCVYRKTGTMINAHIPALRSLVYLYVPGYAGILYRYRGKCLSSIIKSLFFIILTAFLSQWFATSVFVGFSIGAICTFLLLYAILKGWFEVNRKRIAAFIAITAVMISVFILYIAFFAYDYQRIRLLAFLEQNHYPETANFQLTLVRHVLTNAQIIGTNAETVLEKGLVHNDTFLILTQSIAMYGIIAGIAIIVAFVLLAYRALNIVKHQKTPFGMMMSAACFLLVFFNCTTGILMN
ncbi:MAG: permease prefix domain 1-containing protein, partial [Lachnospiraceae bacterium]|nr:permease prefix domain 1-containing protein [Lachnospiraceae bacterium]